MIGICVRNHPVFQIQLLLLTNMSQIIFISLVKPYDEYQKWLGNIAVNINGAFIQILLYIMMAMIACYVMIQD